MQVQWNFTSASAVFSVHEADCLHLQSKFNLILKQAGKLTLNRYAGQKAIFLPETMHCKNFYKCFYVEYTKKRAMLRRVFWCNFYEKQI